MRADAFLVESGYASGRQKAKELILAGLVTVDGRTLTKASQEISGGEHSVTVGSLCPYVGRGGEKLAGALEAFGLSVEGSVALDIGASTGGFTDCLLQRGAKRVYAVDAGVGQLAKKLREDRRVISRESLNARTLAPEHIGGEAVDLIVMDVSFISATYILPRFRELMRPDGYAVCLIKPQFEVGKASIGKGGIVRDPKAHLSAIERVYDAAVSLGLRPVGLLPSPIKGGDGNREFLICLTPSEEGKETLSRSDIRNILCTTH